MLNPPPRRAEQEADVEAYVLSLLPEEDPRTHLKWRVAVVLARRPWFGPPAQIPHAHFSVPGAHRREVLSLPEDLATRVLSFIPEDDCVPCLPLLVLAVMRGRIPPSLAGLAAHLCARLPRFRQWIDQRRPEASVEYETQPCRDLRVVSLKLEYPRPGQPGSLSFSFLSHLTTLEVGFGLAPAGRVCVRDAR